MALSWDGALIEPVPGFLDGVGLPMLSPAESDEALHTLEFPSRTSVPGTATFGSTLSSAAYNNPSSSSAGCESSVVAVRNPVNYKQLGYQAIPQTPSYDSASQYNEQPLCPPTPYLLQTPHPGPQLPVARGVNSYQPNPASDFGHLAGPYPPTPGDDTGTYGGELVPGLGQEPHYPDAQQTSEAGFANTALSPVSARSQFSSSNSLRTPFIEVIPRLSRDRRNREKNRLAASRCREKSKRYLSELRRMERELAQRKEYLASHVCALKEDVLALKIEILRHAHCDCEHIQNYLSTAARKLV